MLNPAAQARAAKNQERRSLRREAMKLLANDQSGQTLSLLQNARAAQAKAAASADPKSIFGRGGYWGRMFGDWLGGLTGNATIKNWAGSAFDSAGDYIADSIPGGNLLAGGAQALHQSISGRGDYTVSDAMSRSVPSFGGGEVDHVRVRSREYLGPISGSSDFKLVARLLINPGNHTAFPQLAKLAAHFQQYIMRGCVFYYKTTSSVAVNTADPALGQVVLAANYDASEPSYASKAEMMQSQYCSAGVPSQDIVHGIECAAFSNGSEVKRIRHGEPAEFMADPLNTDVGTFQLAVEGTNAAATRIGELWVTYDVLLIKSKDSKGSEVPLFDATFQGTSAAPLGALTQRVNTLGVVVEDPGLPFYAANRTLVFPRFLDDGKYHMSIDLISPTVPDVNGNVAGLVSAGTYAFRMPTIDTLGCSIVRFSPGNAAEHVFADLDSQLTMSSVQSAHYIVDVRTTISNPIAMIRFGAGGLGDLAWPLHQNNGRIRVVISRVPDLLA